MAHNFPFPYLHMKFPDGDLRASAAGAISPGTDLQASAGDPWRFQPVAAGAAVGPAPAGARLELFGSAVGHWHPRRNVLVPQGRVSTDALYPACDSNTQKHLSLSRPRKAQYSSRILPPSAAAALAMNAPTSIANAVAIDTRAACFLAVSAICRNFCCESFN